MNAARHSDRRTNTLHILIGVCLVLFAVYSRLLPHPANFAPIGAVALFSGAILPRKIGIMLPLAAMILSDLFLGLHSTILFTWGSFALIALGSSLYLKKHSLMNILVGSVSASLLFFFLSNFGVWLEGRLYSLTMSGLIECYYNALPFLRNTLLSDMLYSSGFFALYFGFRAIVTHKALFKHPTKLLAN